MQIKEVKPINFLYFRTRTQLKELGRFVGIIARQLYRDAALYDLEVTGPVYWNYHGFNGDETQEVMLEIGIPVAEIPCEYGGKFALRRTDAFQCVSLVHEGSWYDLSKGYTRLLKFMETRNLKPSTERREIYLNVDFANPKANVTEIQIGISAETRVFANLPVTAASVLQFFS